MQMLSCIGPPHLDARLGSAKNNKHPEIHLLYEDVLSASPRTSQTYAQVCGEKNARQGSAVQDIARLLEGVYPAGIQDGAVACAAAQIAIQALLNVLHSRLHALHVALLDCCVSGCYEPGRACSTLQRVVAAVRLCMCSAI